MFLLLLIAGSNLNDRWRDINSKACPMVDDRATQTSYKYYYWLHEQGSMRERFERYCRSVTVELQQQRFITWQDLGNEQALLPESQRIGCGK